MGWEDVLTSWCNGVEVEESTIALVLFLEKTDSQAVHEGSLARSNSAYEGTNYLSAAGIRFIDWLITHMQPSPHLCHVEILLLDKSALTTPNMCFATYLGDEASWRQVDEYYTHREWRALPVIVSSQLRRDCIREQGSPYSLLQYIYATSIGDKLFGLLRPSYKHHPHSSAHCATLTYRILDKVWSYESYAKPFVSEAQSKPRYWHSPTSLYLYILKMTSKLKSTDSRTSELALPASYDLHDPNTNSQKLRANLTTFIRRVIDAAADAQHSNWPEANVRSIEAQRVLAQFALYALRTRSSELI